MDYLITGIGKLLCHTFHKDLVSEMKSRGDNGIVICDGSEFSFFVQGTEVKADNRHILILPQGASYNFKCRKTGVTFTYNFSGTVPGNIPYSIETDSISKCLSYAREMQRTSDIYTKVGLMYRIIGTAVSKEQNICIPEVIKPQVNYIHNNFGNTDINNKFLASLTNISEVYLRKLFVKHLGCSPHEYVVEIRTECAKQMLLDGKSVSEAAALCGFSNVYYFSAAFKGKCGISPSTFAKSHSSI